MTSSEPAPKLAIQKRCSKFEDYYSKERTLMKHKSDVRSLILGALLGAIALFTGAAATNSPISSRFQLSAWGFSSERSTGHGAYVLDTATGEVWLVMESGPRKLVDKLK
jgi:hypothetical protein